MSTITLQLTLPESAAEFLNQQVSAGKFGDVNAYVTALILLAQQESATEMEALLMEGYAGDDPVAHREKQIQKVRELVDPALASLDRGERIPGDVVYRRLEERLRAME